MDKSLTEYLTPETVEEALSFYARFNPGDVCWLAGGTDLKLPVSKSFHAAIDIKRIQALKGTGFLADKTYVIGALTTIQEIEDNPELLENFPVLVEAARQFGSRQVRERGTVGGNICNGSPSADIATALLSLEAELCWQGPEGQVREPLFLYFSQERENRRNKKGYILEKVEIAASALSSGGMYFKLGERSALEIGLASTAVVIRLEDAKIREARISLGGVAPTPVRALKAETLLRGCSKEDQHLFSEAGRMAAAECKPLTDAYASAEYRRAMVEALVNRCIEAVLVKGW